MPSNRIEKHLQGMLQIHLQSFCDSYVYLYVLNTFVLSEICVQKVNELSQYQMIWTDEDGFLLKPLGMIEP